MKTLLLTLVVVTIVCLDLGYTMQCKTCSFYTCPNSETCPDGKNICVKRSWTAVRGDGPKREIRRECAATCPPSKLGLTVFCCTTDNCNH
uniref:Gamma-bungarotoxin n=2 Tax=Bungarus multicinctus TaxID=8616 RepID=3NO5I_BUNMU|nr:RecName: Full=Gamma-bungarotoxin; AltName: Full=Long neurotoxin homolog NTL2I; Flags: Precursor [Bungarus multicinctus]CAA06885.1 neurotoxin-like protein [Bungarus multicinctus multicinctus]CAD01082.1 gamma-bungarotoxin [Bungarus multicinctus]